MAPCGVVFALIFEFGQMKLHTLLPRIVTLFVISKVRLLIANMMHLLVFFISVFALCGNGLRPTSLFRIGALLGNDDKITRKVIKIAVDDLNNQDWMLPETMLSVIEKNVSSYDAMDALGHACDLLGMGVNMLVAVTSCPITITLQSLAEDSHVPLLQSVQGKSCRSTLRTGNYSFSMQPEIHMVAKAVDNHMQLLQIQSFVLVYEDGQEESFVDDFMHLFSKRSQNNRFHTSLVFQLSKSNGKEETLLQATNYLAKLFHTNHVVPLGGVILYLKPDIAMELVSMLHLRNPSESLYVHWIIVGEYYIEDDLRRLESYTTSKITIVNQYVDKSNPTYKKFVDTWNSDVSKNADCKTCPSLTPSTIPIEAFHVYDGIKHIGQALSRAIIDGNFFSAASLSCKAGKMDFWRGGKPLMDYIKEVQTVGLLSKADISGTGANQNVNFAILQKNFGKGQKFNEKYVWNPKFNANFEQFSNLSKNTTIRVVTLEEAPFVMITKSNTGEIHYDGFAIDLLNALSKSIGFKYEMYEVEDKKYGEILSDGSWNGLVGDIMHGKADIAVAAMTITADREKVVDFSKRYMDYSVGIVVKRPEESANLFSFIAPFHTSVWFCIMCAFILVVVFIYILNMISPNRKKAWNKSADTKDQISISSVFWFACGSLMQQGPDLHKITIPGRIIMGFWWLFTLIVVSTYTANLAAFLTVKRMDSPIQSFHDLVKQTDIKYGTVTGTSIYNFIMRNAEESKDPSSFYNRMFRMINTTSNHINEAKEGFQRAESGRFAFLWDVAVIEHEVINHASCRLASVGGSIYNKGYGFALPHGSIYCDQLSLGILDLQDSGEIETLRQKWWPKSGKCSAHKTASTSGAELSLKTFTGVFFILAFGLLLAWIFAIGEILVHIFHGKDYPPTAKTLQQNELENNSKHEDIYVVLNKKDLIRQLAEYLSSNKVTDEEGSEKSTAKQGEPTLVPLDNLESCKINLSYQQTNNTKQMDKSQMPISTSSENAYSPKGSLFKYQTSIKRCKNKRGAYSLKALESINEYNHDDLFANHNLPPIFKKSEV